MQVVNHKKWQGVTQRGLSPLMEDVKVVSDSVGFTLKADVRTDVQGGCIYLRLLVDSDKDPEHKDRPERNVQRIPFDDVFPLHAVPEGAIDIRSFAEKDCAPTEAYECGLEALLIPKSRLEIELRPDPAGCGISDDDDEIEFALYVGTFVTTARVPLKLVSGLLEADLPDIDED